MPDLIHLFCFFLGAGMAALFAYQGALMLVGLLFRRRSARHDAPPAREARRYAALIAARNEEAVIAELIGSLKGQDYPAGKLDIFVVADNCTDATAAAARRAGAAVFERFDRAHVGKGYALDFLFSRLRAAGLEERYAGYFIFDADNLVDPAFVRRMNDLNCSGDYAAITCYRNSKNYGANWISAGYSLWFLREARFLNFPRMLLGSSCTVSGTGFLISAAVIRENGGWPFHLLTEDLQFSADCVAGGKRIGYCDKAVLYDEQPTSFRQSWDQRLRWTKGLYQVTGRYGPELLRGALRGGRRGFSCYDVLMAVAPGTLFVVSLLLYLLAAAALAFLQPGSLSAGALAAALPLLLSNLATSYGGLAALGFLTLISEWRNIRATRAQKLGYALLFPLFMLTYLPLTLAALRRTVAWTPIAHHSVRHTPARRAARRPPRLAERFANIL